MVLLVISYQNDMYLEDLIQDIKPLIKAFFKKEELIVKINSLDSYEPVSKEMILIEVEFYQNSYKLLYKDSLIELNENSILPNESEREQRDVFDKSVRRAYRKHFMLSLYRLLNKATKTSLPWGVLTGVRPVKLTLDLLEHNYSEAEIEQYMKEYYYCSKEKIDLSLAVAKREQEILNEIDYKNGYSLYVGIPFCPTTCAYCSFASNPLLTSERFIIPYLTALNKEIISMSDAFYGKNLNTIYIGGGTPTTLTIDQLENLITTIKKYYNITSSSEFTVEAGRPDTIIKEKLKVLKDLGVTRISINPQTMRQKTLDLIGRKHTTKEIEEAFYLAREVGHNNINMDLIIGLPEETTDDIRYTLEKISKMQPDSLTVHTLAIKRASKLMEQGYLSCFESEVSQMQKLTYYFAKEEGYSPYYLYRLKNMADNLENIGYSKPGKEGIYNILIMEEKQSILALGAGASSKFVFHKENQNKDSIMNSIRIERVENVKSLKDYLERIDEMILRKKVFLNNNSNLL